MLEVRTRADLIRALIKKTPEIHIADPTLAFYIMTRSARSRCIILATCVQGYKIHVVKCLGVVDVSFVLSSNLQGESDCHPAFTRQIHTHGDARS